LSEPFWKFLVAMVSLTTLSLSILVVHTEKGEAAEQQIVSQQQGLQATKIIDAVVKNNRGDEMGEVDDLVINQEGKVEKIILAVGGFRFNGNGRKVSSTSV